MHLNFFIRYERTNLALSPSKRSRASTYSSSSSERSSSMLSSASSSELSSERSRPGSAYARGPPRSRWSTLESASGVVFRLSMSANGGGSKRDRDFRIRSCSASAARMAGCACSERGCGGRGPRASRRSSRVARRRLPCRTLFAAGDAIAGGGERSRLPWHSAYAQLFMLCAARKGTPATRGRGRRAANPNPTPNPPIPPNPPPRTCSDWRQSCRAPPLQPTHPHFSGRRRGRPLAARSPAPRAAPAAPPTHPPNPRLPRAPPACSAKRDRPPRAR